MHNITDIMLQVERYLEAWKSGVYTKPGPFEKALDSETTAFFDVWVEPLLVKPGRVAEILKKLAIRIEGTKRRAPGAVSQRVGKAKCIASSDTY
jgi:hypothetical protein